MDKKWLLEHSNLTNIADCVHLIKEYCKDTERKEEDIKKLLEAVFANPLLLTEAVHNIQTLYFKKYNICILTDQQNKIIKLF